MKTGLSCRGRTVVLPLGVAPMAALVVVPKCPICFAAYFGFLSSFGLDAVMLAKWTFPILGFFGFYLLLKLFRTGLESRQFLPFWLSWVGFAAIFASHYLPSGRIVGLLGFALVCLGLLQPRIRVTLSKKTNYCHGIQIEK